jgi:hypothetical protein
MPPAADPPGPPALDSDRGRDLLARARQIRQEAGVSFDRMAATLGIGKATLSVWERTPPRRLGQDRRTWGTPEYWVACLDVLDREQASGAR